MKILVVDDEFVSRKKAEKILSLYGDTDVAINGAEALEAFQIAHKDLKPYNLITMDIMMPDMDGIEVLKKIRKWEETNGIQFGKGVKVVMLTASKASDSVLSSFSEGCEAYIVKPFNKEKMDNALRELGINGNGTG